MEPELSDADLVAMLAEQPTEEHTPETAQPSVPRYERRLPGDQLVSEARGQHARLRAPEAEAVASSRGQRWLTMALAFACGLLLVITIALLRSRASAVNAPVIPTRVGRAERRVAANSVGAADRCSPRRTRFSLRSPTSWGVARGSRRREASTRCWMA